MRKLITWLVLFGLLLIVVTMVRSSKHTTVISSDIPGREGETICDVDNRPVIILNSEVVGTTEERFVRIHEFTHVRAMHGNCQLFQSRYNLDPTFRVAEELRAYCTEAIERVRYGFNADSVNHHIRLIFDRVYGADTTKINCGGHNESPP